MIKTVSSLREAESMNLDECVYKGDVYAKTLIGKYAKKSTSLVDFTRRGSTYIMSPSKKGILDINFHGLESSCTDFYVNLSKDSKNHACTFIGPGSKNTAKQKHAFIGIGSENVVDGASCILAGEQNFLRGDRSQVSGLDNNLKGDDSCIVASSRCKLKGNSSVIISGTQNEITGNHSCVLSGTNNVIKESNSVILSGENNYIAAPNSCILSGKNNVLEEKGVILTGNNVNSRIKNSVVIGSLTGNSKSVFMQIEGEEYLTSDSLEPNALNCLPNTDCILTITINGTTSGKWVVKIDNNVHIKEIASFGPPPEISLTDIIKIKMPRGMYSGLIECVS